jgi:hypothetical protein
MRTIVPQNSNVSFFILYNNVDATERWPSWFKAHAWNACWGESPSQVRILSSPPNVGELKL